MENLSSTTKKQIVLSRVIYDFIINGLGDALNSLSEQEMQLLAMRLNIQAITHAIDLSKQEEITDFTYVFDQLGITFDTIVPLSQVEFSLSFIDQHIDALRTELGSEFDEMVVFFEKMQTEVI